MYKIPSVLKKRSIWHVVQQLKSQPVLSWVLLLLYIYRERYALVTMIGNVLHPSVPVHNNEDFNEIVRTNGDCTGGDIWGQMLWRVVEEGAVSRNKIADPWRVHRRWNELPNPILNCFQCEKNIPTWIWSWWLMELTAIEGSRLREAEATISKGPPCFCNKLLSISRCRASETKVSSLFCVTKFLTGFEWKCSKLHSKEIVSCYSIGGFWKLSWAEPDSVWTEGVRVLFSRTP